MKTLCDVTEKANFKGKPKADAVDLVPSVSLFPNVKTASIKWELLVSHILLLNVDTVEQFLFQHLDWKS